MLFISYKKKKKLVYTLTENSILLRYWCHVLIVRTNVFSDIAPGSLLHSYKRSFNGFVAKLTEKEAQQMSGVCEVALSFFILFLFFFKDKSH